MKIDKFKLILGIILLLIFDVVSAVLMFIFQRDSINLGAVIIFSIIYEKCIRDEVLISKLREKIPKSALTFLGFVLVVIGMALMPKTIGSLIPSSLQGLAYGASFLFWTVGMMFWDCRYNIT